MLGVPACAVEWYVAPGGAAENSGTRAAPWDIESALDGRQRIAPGDTVTLMAGTYRRRPREQYEVRLAGTADKPVVVRGEPGKRVTIDGGLAVVEPSDYLWIRDLEIIVSEPQPEKPVGPGSFPADFTRPWGGLNVHAGKGRKFIHLVIHGTRQAVSWWAGSTDSELYGCILYDNGWPATDRGHGHAIYTQNKDGLKRITDCIMTGGWGYTLHAYGSKNAYVDNYLVQGNIVYDAHDFLIGGGRPSHGIYVEDNLLHGVPMRLGHGAENEDCTVRGNHIFNAGLTIDRFKKVTNQGNTVVAPGAKADFAGCLQYRISPYTPGRVHIAYVDIEHRGYLDLQVDAVLKPGDHYRLLDPRDFYGKPVQEGTYDGGRTIRVPLHKEYTAFVLLRA